MRSKNRPEKATFGEKLVAIGVGNTSP
jgi:hypothetical protein